MVLLRLQGRAARRRHRSECRAALSSRGGFTLAELIVVAAIVGILAGLAIPNLRNVVTRARAAEVVGDLNVVRVAALSYNGQHHTWPVEAGPGSVPAGLEPFLPEDFSFNRDGYDLDYENWDILGGLPGYPATTTIIGVSVSTTDAVLADAVAELMGNAIVFSLGTTHTVLIDQN